MEPLGVTVFVLTGSQCRGGRVRLVTDTGRKSLKPGTVVESGVKKRVQGGLEFFFIKKTFCTKIVTSR